MKLSFENYLKTIIAGIAILTTITGAFFLFTTNFDGIEFNGDSHVYFLNAQHFSYSLAIPDFPKPTYWPYGYPALLSLSFTLGDISFETARWVNVAFGGFLAISFCLVSILIADIKKISNDETLLLVLAAGIFPLGHGLFLKYQLSMMSDMVSAFLNVLTILLCWKGRNTNNLITIALAGLVLGLSVFTRYVNALMLVPACTVLLYGKKIDLLISFQKTLLPLFVFGATALLIFSPQLYITLQDTSSSIENGLLNDWSFKNFISLKHESIDGSQTAKISSIFYYLLLPFRWQSFTPLGVVLATLGIKYSIRELPKWIWVSMFTWYGIHYLLLCGIPLQNSRIGFPLFLPVVLWLSWGILECRILWKNYFPEIVWVITITWLVSLGLSFKATYDFIRSKNDLKNTAAKVIRSIPPGSRVISTSLFAVYKAYPMNVEPLSIYTLPIEEAEKIFRMEKATFLAIDEKRFIPQWDTYPPGKCYRWIKENYSCTVKFVVDDYTIYEVKPKTSLP
jgi:hypothetical protein